MKSKRQYRDYETAFFEGITKKLLRAMDTYDGPYFAAFDADGTLWDNDLGEQFFQYQIDHAELPSLQGLDPWEHYNNEKQKHPQMAYLWLAQISQGQSFSRSKIGPKPLLKAALCESLNRKRSSFNG